MTQGLLGALMFDWSLIDTVLLDMDGTLLDLHFDNHFWLHHVPRRYAESRGLSLAVATEELMQRYRSVEGTLDWYCVDHWSRELGINIARLKEEVDEYIDYAQYGFAFVDQGDIDSELAIALDELLGAIQWIDEPVGLPFSSGVIRNNRGFF